MTERTRPGTRTHHTDGMLAGALIALGALAVIDNVVFHWWLGFHRFNDAWSHQANLAIEGALLVAGLAMLAIGLRRIR